MSIALGRFFAKLSGEPPRSIPKSNISDFLTFAIEWARPKNLFEVFLRKDGMKANLKRLQTTSKKLLPGTVYTGVPITYNPTFTSATDF